VTFDLSCAGLTRASMQLHCPMDCRVKSGNDEEWAKCSRNTLCRRAFITLLGGAAAAWPLATRAQQPAGLRRVGVVVTYAKDEQENQGWLAAFHETLEKLGWIDGQNIKFEYRWTGDSAALLEQVATELVTLQPDLILVGGSPATAYLLKHTKTIPLVFVNIVDPVGQGFVASLSHPGGNATGLVNLDPSMAGKWIGLLKEIVPTLTRIAVPFNPVSAPYAELYLNVFRTAAPGFGVEVIPQSVADMDALDGFIAAQAREPNTAIIPMPSAFSSGHTAELAAMMVRYRLPALYPVRSFAVAGGLLAYGNDVSDNYRQAATFVDKILKGAKPSELPVQFPTKFNLVINLKTASSLGVKVPLTLQASADEVIE
jgi:putative tryptophan/tyrosine transport system substrate-binding protein